MELTKKVKARIQMKKRWATDEKYRKKMSTRWLGKKHNKTSKELMSIKQKEKWIRLKSNPIAYKQFLEKTSKASKGRKMPEGVKSKNWKGGSFITNGYIYTYAPTHPFAKKGGGGTKSRYVLEHRLVMEKIVGRYLTKEEDVHHINGNLQDNRPENLMIVSHNKHFSKHGCPNCGFIFGMK